MPAGGRGNPLPLGDGPRRLPASTAAPAFAQQAWHASFPLLVRSLGRPINLSRATPAGIGEGRRVWQKRGSYLSKQTSTEHGDHDTNRMAPDSKRRNVQRYDRR